MTDALRNLQESEQVQQLLRQVGSARLAEELGSREEFPDLRKAPAQLRVAAAIALAELLNESSVDSLLRHFAKDEEPRPLERVLTRSGQVELPEQGCEPGMRVQRCKEERALDTVHRAGALLERSFQAIHGLVLFAK